MLKIHDYKFRDIIFQTSCKLIKFEHSFTPYTSVNSNWLNDFNVRYDTVKSLQDDIRKDSLT